MAPRTAESLLEERWAALWAAQGDLGVSRGDFVRRAAETVAGRLAAGAPDAAVVIERMALEDLHLAMGCLAGNARAMNLFMSDHGPALRGLVRCIAPGWLADDVHQEILATLFVPLRGEGERGARLASYRGTGSLRGWLRVIVRRLVLDLIRRARRRRECAARLADEPVEQVEEPDVVVMDAVRRLRPHFVDALASLEPEDRGLLVLRHRDARVLRDIAGRLGLDMSSTYRQLNRAQGRLLVAFRDRARSGLGLDDVELRQLIAPLAEVISLEELFGAVMLLLLAGLPGGLL